MLNHTKTPIFFVGNDPLRGLGPETFWPNYHVICHDDLSVIDQMQARGMQVFSLQRELDKEFNTVRNTRSVLLNPLVQKYILDHSDNQVGVLVFKPLFDLGKVLSTTELGKKRQVISLNNSAKLSGIIEDKIKFLKLCRELGLPHPPSDLCQLENIDFSYFTNQFGTPFVVQFARGWFGNHTYFIENEAMLKTLKKMYSNRTVKVSQFIHGSTLTNNAVVDADVTWQSYPFFQVCGVTSLARHAGSTVGNHWGSIASEFKSSVNIEAQVKEYTNRVADALRQQSYRGWFGLDFIVQADGVVWVQEINPRLTASVSMHVQLEDQLLGTNLLEKHFAAFLNSDVTPSVRSLCTPDAFFSQLKGARLLVRNMKSSSIRMEHNFPSGVYCLDSGEVIFVRNGYQLSDLGLREMLVFVAPKGQMVSPDQEYVQIQSIDLSIEELINAAEKIKTQVNK